MREPELSRPHVGPHAGRLAASDVALQQEAPVLLVESWCSERLSPSAGDGRPCLPAGLLGVHGCSPPDESVRVERGNLCAKCY
jgi:hypothetical protein